MAIKISVLCHILYMCYIIILPFLKSLFPDTSCGFLTTLGCIHNYLSASVTYYICKSKFQPFHENVIYSSSRNTKLSSQESSLIFGALYDLLCFECLCGVTRVSLTYYSALWWSVATYFLPNKTKHTYILCIWDTSLFIGLS